MTIGLYAPTSLLSGKRRAREKDVKRAVLVLRYGMQVLLRQATAQFTADGFYPGGHENARPARRCK
jgi:hypothetical protein